ncbi:MAG: SusC/RagA family TonB-linked outer membrane protein, partial [Pedobacter sp.]
MRKIYCLLMAMAVLCTHALAQMKDVIGKVTDAKDGTPLSGVTVKAKSADRTTITTADGSFRLSVPDSETTIVFSFVGYGDVESAVSDLMNVSMSTADRSLSEVVVVGYGTSIKRDVTGNVAKVKGAEVQ